MGATAARSSGLTYRQGTGATWQFYPADISITYQEWYGQEAEAENVSEEEREPEANARRQLDTEEIQMLDTAYFQTVQLGDYID